MDNTEIEEFSKKIKAGLYKLLLLLFILIQSLGKYFDNGLFSAMKVFLWIFFGLVVLLEINSFVNGSRKKKQA